MSGAATLPSTGVRVVENATECRALVGEVLDTLPDWFGDPAAKARYVSAAAEELVLASDAGPVVAGVLTLRRHFAETFEIHVLGVRPQHHRTGHGRRLVEAAARHASDAGGRYLSVKTLGPSRPDPAYAATRAFYRAVGFTPLEEFLSFWRDPPNPCLFLVRPVQ